MSRVLRSGNLLVGLLLVLVLLYVLDTVRGGLDVANVIFIVPVGGIALALGIAVLVSENLRAGREARGAGELPAARARLAWPPDLEAVGTRAALVLVLFVAYVGLMFVLPFDLVAWLFVAAALLVLGERGRILLVLYPLLFAAITALVFRLLLPYPMDTLI
ncbi:MAG: hypothetical protein JSW68_07545 [Burkholderiales bacterium]|nr:MAG: hypothetical protein JSW68_07545 [Burkholderiales bacterium]